MPRARPTPISYGRPTKMTAVVLAKLEEAFCLGCTDVEACYFADISKHTFYRYMLKHPDFAERKDMLKQKPIFTARKSVIDALAGDYNHALRYLERKLKREFSQRIESDVDVTTKGEPITNIIVE